MPFYPKLKFRPEDTPLQKQIKLRVVNRLKVLRAELQKHVEESRDEKVKSKTVKIATWNLREFGNTKYGGRSFEEIYYIAEIISNFDLIALQEIRSDLTEFNKLLQILGPQWDYIATDVTDGGPGNKERMVFLFNRDVVQFRNIAGELTLKENQKVKAYFGERINLVNDIKLDLNGNPDLSGVYGASTKTVSGKVQLGEDLEIPLPDNCNLKLPQGCSLAIKKGTEIIKPERGKAQVTIPTTNISGDIYAIRFPENSFDDSLRQFARTPFLLSFQLGWLKLNLCTVHIYYGSDSADKLNQRKQEIELLTQALANKAKNEFSIDKESFLGVLGDFNIIGKDHPTMKALESNDFFVPDELKSIPGSNVERDKAYDQIAFWTPSNRSTNYSKLEVVGANVFDYYQHVFKLEDEQQYRDEFELFNKPENKRKSEQSNGLKKTSKYKDWRTYKMSDHLPMWVEVRNDFSDEYLKYVESINK